MTYPPSASYRVPRLPRRRLAATPNPYRRRRPLGPPPVPRARRAASRGALAARVPARSASRAAVALAAGRWRWPRGMRPSTTRTLCVSCLLTSPVCTENRIAPRRAERGTHASGEDGGRCSRGSGQRDRNGDVRDRLYGDDTHGACRGGERKGFLRHDARARVLAQRAAQLVVEDRAPRTVARFIPGRRDDGVARVRQRNRAAAEGLNGEQNAERNAPDHDLLHTPAGARVLP